ncbi:MAG TPA: class I SAM-dependent methyltransferase [Ilumatobacteraceae bacterium]|nr:class I SAM-dependent methyltransferase [Ilumatobacteraceae bacterium]
MDSEAWDEKYSASELVWSAEPNRFVAAELDDLPPGRAVDLACGEGRNSLWLASKGWDVVGVDFSRVALDKARSIAERRGLHVDWVLADVTTYQPPAGAFDLVLVAYLHLPAAAMGSVFESSVAATAPNGVVFVIGHDITNIADGYGGPQDPAVLYGPDDVTAHLNGLVIDRAERVRRPVDTADGDVEAIDVLVRAHRPGP